MDIDKLLQEQPYSLNKENKEKVLTRELIKLTQKHYSSSINYQKMMNAIGLDYKKIRSYYDIPFLPVRMFKELDLLSIPKEDVVKTMKSSGTSGQQVSKIYLDRETSSLQTDQLHVLDQRFLVWQ